MQLWAGYMEPPGEHGGPVKAFVEQPGARRATAGMLAALGLPANLAAKGYSATLRLGHLVSASTARLRRAPSIPGTSVPRQWMQIWPARGTKQWPPQMMATSIRLPPLGGGFRISRTDISERGT